MLVSVLFYATDAGEQKRENRKRTKYRNSQNTEIVLENEQTNKKEKSSKFFVMKNKVGINWWTAVLKDHVQSNAFFFCWTISHSTRNQTNWRYVQ